MNEQALIDQLELLPHPEGGFYKETYRSAEAISASALPKRFTQGDRSFSTMIYFLLVEDNFSAFHRIKADEGWHFYTGTPIKITEITPEGKWLETVLGNQPHLQQTFQHWVPAGNWFASEVLDRKGFGLVGCTVAPGFDFRDFEMADRKQLTALHPAHAQGIARLTR